MKVVNFLLVAIVALLSIAAGLAKVLQTQQEMEFLQGVGLSPALIIAFGAVQLAGGVLLLFKNTRIVGAALATLAFVASTILLFVGGNMALGWVSVIPVALTCAILYRTASTSNNKSLNSDTGAEGAG